MKRAGFTLVEVMVASVIVVMLAAMFVALLSQTSGIWRRTAAKVEQFRAARAAFETITTRLAQATLNVYWDYDNPTLPTKYRRRSELRFVSGPADQLLGTAPDGRQWLTHAVFFEAPLGVTENDRYRGYENMLCASGFYLELGDDRAMRPSVISEAMVPLRIRPRLYEFWQPGEANRIYKFTSGASGRNYYGREWFRQPLASGAPPVHVLAENILALIITPRLAPAEETEIKGKPATVSDADFSPLAPDYLYDSSPTSVGNPATQRNLDPRTNPVHQLPPLLQVTMVATDEQSAELLGYTTAAADPLGLATKFRQSRDYTSDLLLSGGEESIESKLIAQKVGYRIFNTNVIIRGAKWSREQAEAMTP
ncbi:MAG: Verru_Chthon cassette protein C [Chthoniobacteraceae bacterium]